jgi:glycosyl transferase family 2
VTTDRRELLTIVMPVYNEAGTVGQVLDRLLSIALPIDREIIVVDDGSTDGTGDVLNRYRGVDGVSIILATANGGKGSAVRLGLARAAGTIVTIQDADLELDPSELASLVEPILRDDTRVVYGSRFLAGRPDAPWLTVVANRVLTAVTNLLYRSSLTDMETCYKVMRADVAASLDLEANRFELEPEITAKILLRGYRIKELPIRFEPRSRSAGKKMRWRDGTQALAVLTRLWWRGRANRGRPGTGNGTPIGLLAAVIALAIGAWWNTFAAGGSDSHCYLGQARLFAQGRTSLREPLSLDVAWPAAGLTFAPAGFIPSPVAEGSSVAICSAGLSLAMAPLIFLEPLSKTWSERIAFLIVPGLGALAVWLTFVIGRRLGGPLVGVVSAALLACDPIFLYQIVQPMSDVPAAALWLAVVVMVTGPSPRSALSGGLAGSLAITTRPNLLPLAAVVALYVAATAYREEGPRAALVQPVAFGFGLVPGGMVVAGFQLAMYGSPLKSGYGDAAGLFAVAHLVPNLRLYLGWLLEVHGPFLGLGLLAPFVLRATNDRRNGSITVLLLALVATTLACYLPYLVFDSWWYIRFLLPAVPLLIVLTVLVFHRALAFVPGLVLARAPVLILGAALLGAWWVKVADDRMAFKLWQLERHFIDAGHYAARLPGSAVVLTVKDSGSVRFYAKHPTVSWNVLEPDWLDPALETLRQKGRKPYLLIEADEEERFKTRFAGQSRLASLDWPPVAQIGTSIRVYDPDDRRRYLAGETVASERLWSPVARPR